MFGKKIKKKVVEEVEEQIIKQENSIPGFDPDMPENKQRWLR